MFDDYVLFLVETIHTEDQMKDFMRNLINDAPPQIAAFTGIFIYMLTKLKKIIYPELFSDIYMCTNPTLYFPTLLLYKSCEALKSPNLLPEKKCFLFHAYGNWERGKLKNCHFW